MHVPLLHHREPLSFKYIAAIKKQREGGVLGNPFGESGKIFELQFSPIAKHWCNLCLVSVFASVNWEEDLRPGGTVEKRKVLVHSRPVLPGSCFP